MPPSKHKTDLRNRLRLARVASGQCSPEDEHNRQLEAEKLAEKAADGKKRRLPSMYLDGPTVFGEEVRERQLEFKQNCRLPWSAALTVHEQADEAAATPIPVALETPLVAPDQRDLEHLEDEILSQTPTFADSPHIMQIDENYSAGSSSMLLATNVHTSKRTTRRSSLLGDFDANSNSCNVTIVDDDDACSLHELYDSDDDYDDDYAPPVETGDSSDDTNTQTSSYKASTTSSAGSSRASSTTRKSMQAMFELLLEKEEFLISLQKTICCLKPPASRSFALRVDVPIMCINAFKLNGSASECIATFKNVVSRRSVYDYISDACNGDISMQRSRVGIRPRCISQYHWFYDSKEVQAKFTALVVEKFNNIDKQALTIRHLQQILNDVVIPFAQELEPETDLIMPVGISTARRYGKSVGILYKDYKATQPYSIGHEMADVKAERAAFTLTWEAVWPHVDRIDDANEPLKAEPVPEETNEPFLQQFIGKKFAIFTQDETTFKTKDSTRKGLLPEGCQRMMPKSAGEGLMVSDFISTLKGNEKVRIHSEEHRSRVESLLGRPVDRDDAMLQLNYNRDGYFTAEKFQHDLEEVAAIISGDPLMEGYHGLIVLDSSTVHRARGTNFDTWTVGPSSKVRNFPEKIVYDEFGTTTELFLADENGTFKGLKCIAESLGFDKNVHAKSAKRAIKSDFVDFLLQQPAFLDAERKAADVIAERFGNLSVFWLPRYHCELNAIERVWAYMKRICRANSDWTRNTMLQNIAEAKEKLPELTILKYFRRVHKICELYVQGKDLSTIFKELYNKHRAWNQHTRVGEEE